MKLFEINAEIRNLEEQLNEWAEEHEGDVTECPVNIDLKTLSDERNEKLLSLAALYKEIEADGESIYNIIKGLQKRMTTIGNRSEWLKSFISSQIGNGEKLSDARAVISWRKSEVIEVDVEAEKLPIEYQTTKTTISANKTELKDAIKSGKTIQGVSLVPKNNLQIK